jgi:hypothetical protein
MEYKQHESSRVAVHNIGVDMQLNNFKRTIKMAQIKALWILVDFLTGSFTIMGIIANFDNIKAWILFATSLTFLLIRGIVYVVQKKQAIRDKELDIWEKEQDKLDRIKRNNRFKN